MYLQLIATVADHVGSTSSPLQIIEILVGIITIFGGGGVVVIIKSLKTQAGQQAVRDYQFSELIHPETGVMAELQRQNAHIRKLFRRLDENDFRYERLSSELSKKADKVP